MRTKDQIGGEPDQAVPPAGRAAFDRFEQEVAAAGLDQFQRGGDRRFGVGDLRQPDDPGAAIGIGGTRGVDAADARVGAQGVVSGA